MRNRLANTAFLIVLAACNGGGTIEDSATAPSGSELAHASYSGIIDEPVALTGGRWEGEPYVAGGASRPTIGLIDHFILTGDLDGDACDEAVTLLWASSGGSGNRLYLAVMGRQNKDVENLGTTLIGDRVQVRSGAIDNGEITLDMVRASPEDAACCPTQRALVTWKLGGDGLTQIADQTVGTLSLADLGGLKWVLLELGREQPVPQDFEITLVFQGDKVLGFSGCNNYFAGIATSSPREFSFNGMGATRMACPEPVMDVERRYLQTLAGAAGFRFLAGRLVLTCDTDEGPRELVFTARKNSAGIPGETEE